ncbi:MAG TPA: hypothetical protein VL495_03985 [Edaphobacter sp.]|nr:hypothetical protein [Edaphobacter sp.]
MFLIASAFAEGQQPIGSVGLQDATVVGPLQVSNGRAVLEGASTITARDHTAEVALQRGGTVRVCSTSGLQLAAGKAAENGAAEAPLILSLDRGAIEVGTRVTTSDVLMTPDLRFTMTTPGTLDLRLRVTRNGDTCVENRGTAAPTLGVSDQFGESSYQVKPGQHVLFEHGSVKEVVDNEHEPCGCPAAPVVSVAEAGKAGTPETAAAPGSTVAAKQAAEQHPFPAAQSAGLAPVSGPPQTPAGTVHAQVSTTMSYGGETAPATGANDDRAGVRAGGATATSPNEVKATLTPPAETSTPAEGETSGVKAQAPPPPPAPPANDVFHAIGHFFKKLFGGH